MKLFAGQQMEGSPNATPAPIEITARERDIDRVLADSFPASDSPPWTLGVPRDPANESANMDASATSPRNNQSFKPTNKTMTASSFDADEEIESFPSLFVWPIEREINAIAMA